MKILYALALPAFAGLACAGCAVVDQDTFASAPEAKPAAATVAAPAAAPRIDPRTPLISIDYTTPNPDYREMVRYAVRAAEARGPVQYDVVAVVKSDDESTAAQERAGQVMRAIMAERVPPARIHLGLRAAPSLPNPQIRVYVR
jgi:hypothetical protein